MFSGVFFMVLFHHPFSLMFNHRHHNFLLYTVGIADHEENLYLMIHGIHLCAGNGEMVNALVSFLLLFYKLFVGHKQLLVETCGNAVHPGSALQKGLEVAFCKGVIAFLYSIHGLLLTGNSLRTAYYTHQVNQNH